MPASRFTGAERTVQLKFRKSQAFFGALLVAAILVFAAGVQSLGNRPLASGGTLQLRFERVSLGPVAGRLRLAGAWRLGSDDPRLGGISALAVDGGELLAITDAGSAIRFARPGAAIATARVTDVPGGPGDARFKKGRDSEALLRDSLGRGWWVAFENGHQLWLFDPTFSRPLQRIRLGERRWPSNFGIEAMASDGPSILLLPEAGGAVLKLEGSRLTSRRIAGAPIRTSDSTTSPDGSVLLLERRLTPTGIAVALARLERAGNGYRRTGRIPLRVGRLDNFEALAAEPRPGGGMRLWLMTDDNFQRPMRTLLVALDVPAVRRPPAPARPSGRSRA